MRRLVLAACLLAAAAPAPADESPRIAAGERVRLQLSEAGPAGHSFEAVMNRIDSDSIQVTPRGTGAVRGWALGDVAHLDHYAGRDRSVGMRRGFLIGLGAGVAAGLAIGMLLGTADDASFGDGFAFAIPLGAIAGAAAGAAAGSDRWERVW